MAFIHIFIAAVLALGVTTEAVECENGWTAHRDEICIKLFPNLLKYEDAKAFCISQGDDTSKSSLVAVKSQQLQDILVNLTEDVFDNVWLGGRYDQAAADFKWEDGESFTYTNWQEGYPRNSSDSDICVELRPVNAQDTVITSEGKWADVSCQKHNYVICQRDLSWSLQDAIAEIIKMRKQIDDGITERNELREQLQTAQEDIQEISGKVVPVGSTYIEYYDQPSPEALWPNLAWEDISSSFEGLFFRVTGGGAETWGSTQTECAPRVTQISTGERIISGQGEYVRAVMVPQGGWSQSVRTGAHAKPVNYSEGLSVLTEDCEVRPRNQAVRVWKRIA